MTEYKKKAGYRKSESLKSFVKDVKMNGVCFVKSAIVANELKAYDPKLIITWNKEDKTYYVTYGE
jgi:hypothetical protein